MLKINTQTIVSELFGQKVGMLLAMKALKPAKPSRNPFTPGSPSLGMFRESWRSWSCSGSGRGDIRGSAAPTRPRKGKSWSTVPPAEPGKGTVSLSFLSDLRCPKFLKTLFPSKKLKRGAGAIA